MAIRELPPDGQLAVERVLGYLNYSSGAPDPQFLAGLNRLFALCQQHHEASNDSPADPLTPSPRQRLFELLDDQLTRLQAESSTFENADQARAVLALVADHVIPGYRRHHGGLLFHQNDGILFNPMMLGRICEAVMQQGPPWDDTQRIRDGAIRQLNDFIGHRPVAVLESQKIEPHAHEWVRPVPLYVRDAGVAVGPYHDLIETALALIEQTDGDLLAEAHFDPQQLREMAIDPRAYDFDHPAHKRPVYLFGQWDPHRIDNHGRYERFVLQQVTLDALLHRVTQSGQDQRDEMLLEAAAVLAGTMLMASGISGGGPDTHDSNTTLHTLLPLIAKYRDDFYRRLLHGLSGSHAERLRVEAAERRQPFGGARQHLNRQLARLRAAQLERVCLAKIFARMGYPEAARRQMEAVPVASARMACRIECLLTAGQQAVDRNDLSRSVELLREIVDRLHRSIECGAMVDPWNILGFDSHFSLFPAAENSVHDYRIDELIALIDQIFSLYTRVWSEAAAADDESLCQEVAGDFHKTVRWWHQFAAHEVTSVDCPAALDVFQAARNVSQALNLWHKGGAATGDVQFWAPHVEMFDTPRAYTLVVSALLDQGDLVASMALLVNWLSRAENVALQRGQYSFHRLLRRWAFDVLRAGRDDGAADDWPRLCKMIDHLEANGEHFWSVPRFELNGNGNGRNEHAVDADLDDAEEDDADNLYDAAYEDVVYRDSTDDGVDSELFDVDGATQDQLDHEAKRISERLAFLNDMAELWKTAALAQPAPSKPPEAEPGNRRRATPAEVLRHWLRQALENRRQLMALLRSVAGYRIKRSGGDRESNLQYDRQRLVKETLLERIIATSVATTEAVCFMLAAVKNDPAAEGETLAAVGKLNQDQQQAAELFAAALAGDVSRVKRCWPVLLETLRRRPILYVPLAKGGEPRQILRVRVRQQIIRGLLIWLPRLGLLRQACELIEAARRMEQQHAVGPGAITEFDDLFQTGYRALVESIVRAARPPGSDNATRPHETATKLVTCLEQVTHVLLKGWLRHSRTLRLSVLEKVSSRGDWKDLVDFIKQYGGDLFTQQFLNLGNIRAILHQGVDAWIEQLLEDPRDDDSWAFLDALGKELPRDRAVRHISTVLEAVIENFSEYGDYNSTTTQSDRGDLIFSLLDFLRLRNGYERVAWDLKPVVLAHEILVRHGLNEAAQFWRRSLAERVGEKADQYLQQLERLQQKYAMRVPTVGDRLRERFLRPLVIDRLCALVEPAMTEASTPAPHTVFELFEEETALLTETPTGVGLQVPAWLVALEEEVERCHKPAHEKHEHALLNVVLPAKRLTMSQVQRQLEAMLQAEQV